MKHLLTALLVSLISAPALAENSGVAAALGLEDSSVAAAVESGARQNIHHSEKEKDPTIRTMNEETSVFLRNAPRRAEVVADVAPREASFGTVEKIRTQKEVERDLALQQLEFRRNVEDAMKRILSFSPSVRNGERAALPRPDTSLPDTPVSAPIDPAPLSARDRLLQSASGNVSPFRSLSIPNEFREAPQVEQSPVDERVTAPARFEASPDDDDGKPVRVSTTGESSGAESTIISMRRNSRKDSPSTISRVPTPNGKHSDTLPPLVGLPKTTRGF
jgi:hypothetical protein